MKVTIRVERGDGQFAIAVRDLPADLAGRPGRREAITDEVAAEFVGLYLKVAGLSS